MICHLYIGTRRHKTVDSFCPVIKYFHFPWNFFHQREKLGIFNTSSEGNCSFFFLRRRFLKCTLLERECLSVCLSACLCSSSISYKWRISVIFKYHPAEAADPLSLKIPNWKATHMRPSCKKATRVKLGPKPRH